MAPQRYCLRRRCSRNVTEEQGQEDEEPDQEAPRRHRGHGDHRLLTAATGQPLMFRPPMYVAGCTSPESRASPSIAVRSFATTSLRPEAAPGSQSPARSAHGSAGGQEPLVALVLPRTIRSHGKLTRRAGWPGLWMRSSSIRAPTRAISRLGCRTVVRLKESQAAMSTSS
ncbi:hypothetical protein SRABI83_01400 [Arthrobacter sp. Bi83]|nr:hypothetical protein SRABI83_01400 [Arthrobacter sp. Bi83]